MQNMTSFRMRETICFIFDEIFGGEVLQSLHAEIPLNDFPANHGIDDFIAAVQLITLSRDKMQS